MSEILPDACGRCGGLVSSIPPVTGGGAYRHLDTDMDLDHTAILGTPPPPDAASRDRYDVEHEVEVVVIPAPSVPATAVELGDDRVPRSARIMAKHAATAGWSTRLVYSKGPLLDSTGTKVMSQDCESVVLKASSERGIFDATWLFRPNLTEPKWAFDTAWCSLAGGDGFHQRTSTELRALLKGGTAS